VVQPAADPAATGAVDRVRTGPIARAVREVSAPAEPVAADPVRGPDGAQEPVSDEQVRDVTRRRDALPEHLDFITGLGLRARKGEDDEVGPSS
jgi:hypothetical protein